MTRLLSLVVAILAVLQSVTTVGAAPAAPNPLGPVAPRSGPIEEPQPEIVPDRVVVRWKDADVAVEEAAEHGLEPLPEPAPEPTETAAPAEEAPAEEAPAEEAPAEEVPVAEPPAEEPPVDVLDTNGRDVEQVVAELEADPNVVYAEPDYVIELSEEPMPIETQAIVPVNDPRTSTQYSLDRMRVRDGWSVSRGGSRVIAVLDTGIQYGHPDLAGRIVAGYDFVNLDADPRDDNRHGTWVAGIIAANPNDGVGVAGISWSDKIMPVKVMNALGQGVESDLAFGIRWAVDHGASIINMSVGGYGASTFLRESINYAWAHGAVLVGAAGNNRREELFYPASFGNVISVTATQIDDEFTNWSSYGAAVDVSAPGDAVLTTSCGGCSPSAVGNPTWEHISGTSFAAPNVSGVLSLIWGLNPGWTNEQVVTQLYATLDDLGYAGWDNRYGRGRVNAWRALGGTPPAPPASPGDGLEGNNGFGSAKPIALGVTTSPSIHPAGDVDFFTVDAPRAGRIDVTVTAVTDVRPFPWQKGSLFIDPIVELYDGAGNLLQRVDDPSNSSATEHAGAQLGAGARLVIGVRNWAPNGNRRAYSITPVFVDNVGPSLLGVQPAGGQAGVGPSGLVATATFNEPVSGVSGSTFVLRGPGGHGVPASIGYDAAARVAVLQPSAPLATGTTYTLVLSTSITDPSGNAFGGASWSFVTSGPGDLRLAGPDRYATAAAASTYRFHPGVPVAYVATGLNFPDALSAGPAAGVAGGPVLLTQPLSIPAATAAELARLRPGRIVVLGGSGVVGDNVVDALRGYATSGEVSRLAGADRYATAAAISAAHFGAGVPVAYVATGHNFPDALAAGAVATRTRGPVLLTEPTAIPAATAAELARLRPGRIVVLGGSGVVGDNVVDALRGYAASGAVSRAAGADRYATAAAISAAQYGAAGAPVVFIATGLNFPDGLAGAPVAGISGGPLLLTHPTSLPAATAAELRRLNPGQIIILGSGGAVSDAVLAQIRALWQ